MDTLMKLLSENAYPGRGIIIGTSPDGKRAVSAYFIMGRSANSRNRVFVADGDGLRTKAYDESKVVDPSLIIYWPVRVLGNCIIVTNGDQTDTIYEGIKNGSTFEQALKLRKFEPDEPNFTPRISGMIDINNGKYEYYLSILKSSDASGCGCNRYTFDYDASLRGVGHFIHTYLGDGSPLPSFEGEPKSVEISDDIDEFTKVIWDNLNADNKVSLFVRYINIFDGSYESRIVNKNI